MQTQFLLVVCAVFMSASAKAQSPCLEKYAKTLLAEADFKSAQATQIVACQLPDLQEDIISCRQAQQELSVSRYTFYRAKNQHVQCQQQERRQRYRLLRKQRQAQIAAQRQREAEQRQREIAEERQGRQEDREERRRDAESEASGGGGNPIRFGGI